MLQRDVRQVAELRQMQQFFDDHAAALRGWDRGPLRQSLDDVTEQLWALAVRQEAEEQGSRGERMNETALANQLRYRYFLPLVRIAATKEFRNTVLRKVKFPHRRSNTTSLVLLARATIGVAAPHERELEAAIAKGFLRKFAAAAETLEASTGAKLGARRTRFGATSAIAKLIKHARVVVDVVDAMLKAHLPENHPLVAEWNIVLRRYRAAGR